MVLQSSIASVFRMGNGRGRSVREGLKFGSSLRFVPWRVGRGFGLDRLRSEPRIGARPPRLAVMESLLTQICDTTSIAKFELKLGGFRLYVIRDLTEKSKPPTPPMSAHVSVNPTAEAPDVNGSVSLPSFAISKPPPPSNGVQTLLDKVADEGLVILKSPRVGYFRRSRTIKGKRAPPPCNEDNVDHQNPTRDEE